RKPGVRGDRVVIPYAERAPTHALGVVVVGKREMVLGVEPAMVGSAQAFKGSAFDHSDSPGSETGCVSAMSYRSRAGRAFSMAAAKTMHRLPAPCSRPNSFLCMQFRNYHIRLSTMLSIPLLFRCQPAQPDVCKALQIFLFWLSNAG